MNPPWDDLPYSRVLHGDCMKLLKTLPSNSVHAIITDPPYGMSSDGIMRSWSDLEEGHNIKGFMGKSWDAAVPCHNFFAECLRVIKPGGHMIAFSSTRTVCMLGMEAQKGGWRIRDMIHWCYFNGFPKSHNIGRAIDREAGHERKSDYVPNDKNHKYGKGMGGGQTTKVDPPVTEAAKIWDGFGTALKPAIEPALLLRKPLEKGLTIAQNVLKHGTGALNIDGCRFGYGDPCWVGPRKDEHRIGQQLTTKRSISNSTSVTLPPHTGDLFDCHGRWPANLYQCAKASRSEREEGLKDLETQTVRSKMNLSNGTGDRFDGSPSPSRSNFHPTVKPLKLMKWCCRLVGGQKGSIILDPFAGSGTTLAAGIIEGFNVIGIEITDQYMPIIEGRVQWAKEQYKRENAQIPLFGVL